MTHEAIQERQLLRVRQIVKPDGMLPICRSSFYNMQKMGLVSQGIRLGARTRVWRASEIIALIDRLESVGAHDV